MRAEVHVQVLGAGRIGTSLAKRAEAHGERCVVHGRDARSFGEGPILVATRNDDLADVLQQVPEARHADLVFVQNGWIAGWLEEQGLGENTRGLLYFAATARHGDIDPGTTSVFHGPHAERVAAWFRSIDLDAEAVDAGRYAEVELEKLAWLCVFGPLCQAHDCTVGEVIDAHPEQLRELTAELAAFGRVVGVDVGTEALLKGLIRYSRTIPGYTAGVKEWRWRNGAVLERMAAAGVPSPLQRRLTGRM